MESPPTAPDEEIDESTGALDVVLTVTARAGAGTVGALRPVSETPGSEIDPKLDSDRLEEVSLGSDDRPTLD